MHDSEGEMNVEGLCSIHNFSGKQDLWCHHFRDDVPIWLILPEVFDKGMRHEEVRGLMSVK